MARHGRTFMMAVGFVLVSAGTAQAKDLCLAVPGIASGVIVGKGFKSPGKNQCKPFNGFESNGTHFVAGVGCRSADGDLLRLSFTMYASSSSLPNPMTVFCGIPHPDLTGGTCLAIGGTPSNTADELFEGTSSASAEACTVDVP